MENVEQKILELSKFTESKFPIDSFLEELLPKILGALGAEFCAVAFSEKAEDQLYFHMCCWKHNNFTKTFLDDFLKVKKGIGSIGICAEKRILQSFVGQDILLIEKKEYGENFNVKPNSILAVPMLSRGELIGVIAVLNKSNENTFSDVDKATLKIFALYAAIIIDNSRLHEESAAKERISNLGQSIINSAHGLKNILNNMDGGAYIVEKGAASKNLKDVEKGWDIIKRNTHRLRDIVLDMLLYSRPKQPEIKPSSINKICEDIEELISQNAKENSVEIKLFLDKGIHDFNFDPTGIHRCLLNLVTNAIYACAQKGGGRVNIMTQLKNLTTIEITISDNGIGISEYNLPYVFDVFFTTKGSSGTGLGLPVAKKIIEDHQGTISVTSSVNIGTRFVITLPNQVAS